jgi:hypothetical protein
MKNWVEEPRELMLSTAPVATAFTLLLVLFANLREHRGGIVCGVAPIAPHRKSLRMILPTLLFGSESTNTITFGTL